MKTDICELCGHESNNLWLLNLAKIDSLSIIKGKNIRQSVCEDCVVALNQVVSELGNGGTAMERAFSKAGVASKNPVNNQAMHRNRNKTMIRDDIQNEFLEDLIKNKKLVQIEALEGIGWRGFVQKYDNFSLLITSEQSDSPELIFKHAIKSIKPL